MAIKYYCFYAEPITSMGITTDYKGYVYCEPNPTTDTVLKESKDGQKVVVHIEADLIDSYYVDSRMGYEGNVWAASIKDGFPTTASFKAIIKANIANLTRYEEGDITDSENPDNPGNNPGSETTSPLVIGSSAMSKAYIGSQEVSKIYLGSNLLYDSGYVPPISTKNMMYLSHFNGNFDYWTQLDDKFVVRNGCSIDTSEDAFGGEGSLRCGTIDDYLELTLPTIEPETYTVEFWTKLDNTTEPSVWQTFVSCLTKDDVTLKYNGWAIRYHPTQYRMCLVYANNSEKLNTKYALGTADVSGFVGNWIHFGFCKKGTDFYFLANGVYNKVDNSANVLGWNNIFRIGNARYSSNGYTLSPIDEVRISYEDAITGWDSSNLTYTIPTVAFEDKGNCFEVSAPPPQLSSLSNPF